jgi:adenosylmethionine-8-amino-7-oxononanoate aminotransferase
MKFVDTAKSRVFHRELDRRYPILTHADGVWISDAEGRRYLDAMSGGAFTANIGYGVKEVIDAAVEQLHKIPWFHNQKATSEAQEKAAADIAARAPFKDARVFFTSSGHDGNETALRLARKYHYDRGDTDRLKVISFAQAYHGSTFGTLVLTGRPGLQDIYAPYLPKHQFRHVPPVHDFRPVNGILPPESAHQVADMIEEIIEQEGPSTISAFFCEPIHAASAPCMTPPPEFWGRLQRIAEKYGILVIFDEVVVGAGRTGTWFASEQLPIDPDIIVTAKGWGSGYAYIGPVLCTNKVFQTISDGSREFSLGSTFNGAAFACAVASAVIRYIESQNLLERVKRLGPIVLEQLRAALKDIPMVAAVRGKGFLFGVEYAQPETLEMFPSSYKASFRVEQEAYQRDLIVYSVAPNADGFVGDSTLLSPAYIATEEELTEMVNRFAASVKRAQEQIQKLSKK